MDEDIKRLLLLPAQFCHVPSWFLLLNLISMWSSFVLDSSIYIFHVKFYCGDKTLNSIKYLLFLQSITNICKHHLWLCDIFRNFDGVNNCVEYIAEILTLIMSGLKKGLAIRIFILIKYTIKLLYNESKYVNIISNRSTYMYLCYSVWSISFSKTSSIFIISSFVVHQF